MKFYLLAPSLIFCVQIFCDKFYYTYDLRLARKYFEDFIKYYNKTYTEKEKRIRFKIFKSNMKIVNALNQNVVHTWIAVIGPYNDLSYSEFINKYNLTRLNTTQNSRFVLNCTEEKPYLFKRFSQYTKTLYDKWGSWQQPVEYEDTEEAMNDYDNPIHDYY